MKTYNPKDGRLNRLFGKTGKCFDVAIDHGFFNEYGFLKSIENMEKAIRTVVNANPDAIQLSPGQAEILQSIPGRDKPALVMRTDVANVYPKKLPEHLYSAVIDGAVETGLRLDAACVVVNLLRLPGRQDIHESCVKNITRLKPECERFGMPLMVEPLVMRDNQDAGGYMVDGDIEKILPLVRQAVELGADIIKADPADDISEYRRVIEIARKPVLVRGGGKAPTEEILIRTRKLMEQGAAGIVYGRNVIQHENPKGMTQALMSIVHDGADEKKAAEFLK